MYVKNHKISRNIPQTIQKRQKMVQLVRINRSWSNGLGGDMIGAGPDPTIGPNTAAAHRRDGRRGNWRRRLDGRQRR